MAIGKMNQRVIVETKVIVGGARTTYGSPNDTYYPALNSSSDTTEAGTTTTNITIADHGLSTGDYIINTTRSKALRQITVVDDDNFTVTAVTGQTSGDSITLHKYSTSKIWAYFKASSGYIDENGQRKIFSNFKVRIRYRDDIDKTQTLRIGTRRFEILGINNEEEKDRYIVLTCKEVK